MSASRVKYLVKDLFPQKMINLVIGKPSSYKSWFIANLAITAAYGDQLFDAYPCEPCFRVIYFDEDTPRLFMSNA